MKLPQVSLEIGEGCPCVKAKTEVFSDRRGLSKAPGFRDKAADKREGFDPGAGICRFPDELQDYRELSGISATG